MWHVDIIYLICRVEICYHKKERNEKQDEKYYVKLTLYDIYKLISDRLSATKEHLESVDVPYFCEDVNHAPGLQRLFRA